jgi:L-rhamnose 1-dehydrogenase
MAGLLKHKVIAVTGSSSGIGRAIALQCARNGASLLLHHLGTESTSTDMQSLQDELSLLSNKSPRIFAADLTGDTAPRDLTLEAVSSFGRLDVLINNAGICIPSPAGEASKALVQKHLDVNFTAAYLLSQAASEQMIIQGQGGSVVTISSNTAIRGVSHVAHYAGSKAALLGMTTSFAVEYGKHNIRYNCILPGPTDTAMIQGFAPDDAGKATMANRIPLGRIGKPEDIAQAAVFFASDASSFITGESLLVDGGGSIFYQ